MKFNKGDKVKIISDDAIGCKDEGKVAIITNIIDALYSYEIKGTKCMDFREGELELVEKADKRKDKYHLVIKSFETEEDLRAYIRNVGLCDLKVVTDPKSIKKVRTSIEHRVRFEEVK